jgi:hypothetical protein
MPQAQQGVAERAPAGLDRLFTQRVGTRFRSVDLGGEFGWVHRAGVHGRLLGFDERNLGSNQRPGNGAARECVLRIVQRQKPFAAPTIDGWTI